MRAAGLGDVIELGLSDAAPEIIEVAEVAALAAKRRLLAGAARFLAARPKFHLHAFSSIAMLLQLFAACMTTLELCRAENLAPIGSNFVNVTQDIFDEISPCCMPIIVQPGNPHFC